MAFSLLKAVLFPKLAALLAPEGFRRHGQCWHRPYSELTHVVCVRASRVNLPGVSRFTINAGVFRPDDHEMTWEKAPPRFPKDTDCILRGRIGMLSPERTDLWWTACASTGADAEDAVRAVKAYALPFLERASAEDQLLHLLVEDAARGPERPLSGIHLALVTGLRGEKLAAIEMLSEIAQAHPAWAHRARQAAERPVRALN